MEKRMSALCAVLALAGCAGEMREPSAQLPAAASAGSDPVGTSGRRHPRPVVTSIVRQRSHAGLYGSIISGAGQPLCGAPYCVGAQAVGACGPSVHLDCGCPGDLYAEVHTGPGNGDCTVTIRVRDQEGLEGAGSVTFPVRD